jgi:hypothetical protein
MIMGRRMNEQPAKCIHCGRDFESSGKMRYQNLKNHLKNVHGIGIADNNHVYSNVHTIINNNINNTYSNCNIINVFDETVRTILRNAINDKEFMDKFIKYAEESIGQYSAACDAAVCLFDKIHCNPEHPETCIAVIPNVSRNTMLVREPEGSFESFDKKDGAEKALSIFENKTVPILKDGFGKPVKRALSGTVHDVDKVELKKKIVKRLEGVDKDTRKVLKSGKYLA